MRRHHAHGVHPEPALPDLRDQLARRGVERELNGAVGIGGVARRHAPVVQQVAVAVLRERGPAAEVLPEVLVRTAVLLPERANRITELREVARLEQCVSGVRRQAAPYVRPEHRNDHRAIAAARFPLDASMCPVGHGPVPLVDEGNDLVTEEPEVVTGSRGIEELAPAERGPAVDPRDDDGRRPAACEEVVCELRVVPAERRAVPPHVELTGEPLDHVDRREPLARVVVVPGRDVDPQWSVGWVPERVAPERLALDRVLLEPPVKVERPRLHRRILLVDPPGPRSLLGYARRPEAVSCPPVGPRPVTANAPHRAATASAPSVSRPLASPKVRPAWKLSPAPYMSTICPGSVAAAYRPRAPSAASQEPPDGPSVRTMRLGAGETSPGSYRSAGSLALPTTASSRTPASASTPSTREVATRTRARRAARNARTSPSLLMTTWGPP